MSAVKVFHGLVRLFWETVHKGSSRGNPFCLDRTLFSVRYHRSICPTMRRFFSRPCIFEIAALVGDWPETEEVPEKTATEARGPRVSQQEFKSMF